MPIEIEKIIEISVQYTKIMNIDTKIKENIVTPFELLNSRLFRIKIFVGNEVYLFIEIHHIIADGTSFNIILNHIEQAYNGVSVNAEKYDSFDLSFDEELKRKTSVLSEAKE